MISISPPVCKCKPFFSPTIPAGRLRVSASAIVTPPATMYEILSVPETAGPGEIKAAYRRQALWWHPDACRSARGEDERLRCADRFMRAREAYEVLSDPVRRRSYDLALSADRWAAAVGVRHGAASGRAWERRRAAGFGDWEAQLEGLRLRSEAAAGGAPAAVEGRRWRGSGCGRRPPPEVRRRGAGGCGEPAAPPQPFDPSIN